MPHSDAQGSLLEETLKLLQNTNLKKIHEETGLPYDWLRKLTSTENPSVNRVQRLYEHLTGKTLLKGGVNVTPDTEGA